MPLEILGPMVVFGIAGIALALHLLGLTSPLRLTSEEAARAAWLREFPDDEITSISLASSGRAALVQLSTSALGLVHTMGADTMAHPLSGAIWHETAQGVRLTLPDFAAPRFDIALTPEERAHWLNEKAAA